MWWWRLDTWRWEEGDGRPCSTGVRCAGYGLRSTSRDVGPLGGGLVGSPFLQPQQDSFSAGWTGQDSILRASVTTAMFWTPAHGRRLTYTLHKRLGAGETKNYMTTKCLE